ncbi:MAG: aquaporin [Spirochaetaceae bacterium]
MSKNIISEFLGTLFLVLTAIGSTILADFVFGAPIYITVFINGIAVAFVLFCLIEMFAPLSGSHFNPAVTISLFVAGEMNKKKAGLYILAQLSGAFIGIIITNLIFFDVNPIILSVSETLITPPKLLSEFICTFILMGAIISLVRGKSKYTSLVIGLLVGGMILVSSSNMYANPAVSFARIFTYAICGISPVSAILYTIVETLGALSALLIFSKLYPLKVEVKCAPFDCSCKKLNL